MFNILRIVDKEGYFIRDDFTFDENTEIGLEVEPSEGIHSPQWDFKKEEWIETARDYERMGFSSQKEMLEHLKQIKKEELSQSCQEDILSGFTLSINNKEYRFSYDREAQTNYHERWQLFQNGVMEEVTMTAHLGDKDVRLVVDKELFNSIYLASVKAKEEKIKRLRDDIYPMVERAKSSDDLENITWDMVILEPEPQGIVLIEENTLDKEIDRQKARSDRLQSEVATTSRGILELAMITLGL